MKKNYFGLINFFEFFQLIKALDLSSNKIKLVFYEKPNHDSKANATVTGFGAYDFKELNDDNYKDNRDVDDDDDDDDEEDDEDDEDDDENEDDDVDDTDNNNGNGDIIYEDILDGKLRCAKSVIVDRRLCKKELRISNSHNSEKHLCSRVVQENEKSSAGVCRVCENKKKNIQIYFAYKNLC